MRESKNDLAAGDRILAGFALFHLDQERFNIAIPADRSIRSRQDPAPATIIGDRAGALVARADAHNVGPGAKGAAALAPLDGVEMEAVDRHAYLWCFCATLPKAATQTGTVCLECALHLFVLYLPFFVKWNIVASNGNNKEKKR